MPRTLCIKCGVRPPYKAPGARWQKSSCLPCDVKQGREWKNKNRERTREYARQYHASHREQEASAQRLRYANERQRWIARHRQWSIAHPDVVQYHHRRRRVRKLNAPGDHSVAQWEELKRKSGFKCLACGESEPQVTLTEDHIVPLSKGGSDDITNIQPLCRSCNMRKFTKTIAYVS